jgi:hypothetical protein
MTHWIEYTTVATGNRSALHREVADFLQAGWQMIGGIAWIQDKYVQAMGKPAAIDLSMTPVARAGDTVILSTERNVHPTQREALKAVLADQMPGIKFVLIDGVKLKVALLAQSNIPE